MAPQMRGLTRFITDLRAGQDTAQERKRINVEINNIRTKFASSLTSYQKRKYVCKLIYIHLLGLTDEVLFGVDHAYLLVNSSNYAEKQLGYLLVSILHSRGSLSQLTFAQQLMERVHSSLMRDLRVDSDETNILALLFIVSNFKFSFCDESPIVITDTDPTVKLWQDITQMVYELCVSPTAPNRVKQKASAAMLVMLRLRPAELTVNDRWIPRLLAMIDDTELSLILSAAPLASFLTDLNPSYAKAIMPSVTQRLHALIVDAICPDEHMYYDVPCPWIVLKLLQLAENYFVRCSSHALDAGTIQDLRYVVSRTIKNALAPRQVQMSRNAHAAILFQAVSILTYLDASTDAVSATVRALVQLVDSADTNTRYLALDTLTKLKARSMSKISFSEHLDKIFSSLDDKDISVRRKAIDLLYIVCDESSYTRIVSRLFEYYPSAEASLQTSLSVKIALIAEQFTMDSTWYVYSMLRLLSISRCASQPVKADGAAAGEVWERVVQVIVNQEDLHIKTSKYIVKLLQRPDTAPTSESLVKAAAFVLGEYGYKLARQSTKSELFGIDVQLRILYDFYFISGLQTRSLLMSAFLKFVSHFPSEDFVPLILDLFEAETYSIDIEIQKRANEYMRVATLLLSESQDDQEFARSLLVPVPPFEGKENKLLKQLGSVALVNRSMSTLKKSTGSLNGDSNDEILTLDSSADPFLPEPSSRQLPLSINWQDGYHRMLLYDAGIFYEDQLLKITYRIQRGGSSYSISFTVINNAAKTSGATITAFTVNNLIYEDNNGYVVTLTKNPELTIADRTTMVLEVRIIDMMQNNKGPVLLMSYKCSGSFNAVRLKIPVVLLKCMSGTTLNSTDDFKKRWVQIGTTLGVENGERSGLFQSPHRYNSPFLVGALQRMGFAIVQKTPENAYKNVMVTGAAIIHTIKSNFGVLVLLCSTDSDARQFQVTVRGTGVGLAANILELLQQILKLQS